MKLLFFLIALLLTVLASAQSPRGYNFHDTLSWKNDNNLMRLLIEKKAWGKPLEENWVDNIQITLQKQVKGKFQDLAVAKETLKYYNGFFRLDRKSYRLQDFDSDGKLEPYVFYLVAKDGLDDDSLKLICFYDLKKIVVKGNVPKMSERREKLNYSVRNEFNVSQTIVQKLTLLWKRQAKELSDSYIRKLEG